MPGGGIRIAIDAKELSALFQAAKAAPGKLQVELRRGVKNAAKPIVSAVKSEASWSSRIPGAVKTKVSFAQSGASVTIYVDPKKAPEAGPLNHDGRSGTFRHPVFGNRDNWVAQQTRPFFAQGVRAGLPGAERAVSECVDDWLRKLGFS